MAPETRTTSGATEKRAGWISRPKKVTAGTGGAQQAPRVVKRVAEPQPLIIVRRAAEKARDPLLLGGAAFALGMGALSVHRRTQRRRIARLFIQAHPVARNRRSRDTGKPLTPRASPATAARIDYRQARRVQRGERSSDS